MKIRTSQTNQSQNDPKEIIVPQNQDGTELYDSHTPDSYDPHIIPAETAARKKREGDHFKHLAQHPAGFNGIDTTGGFTVDKEGLMDNFAIEPEMYYETRGDLRDKVRQQTRAAEHIDEIRQEEIRQEEIRQEEIRQEEIRQEGIRQEKIRREGIRQEKIRREGIRQDEIRQEGIRQEEIRQEGIRQEKIRQDEIRQDEIRQEGIRQDEIRQEGIRQEGIRQEKIRQEKIRQEGIRQEGIRQEGIRQEGIRQEGIRREGIRQDEIRQDEIRQEGIRQEGIRQEKIRQDEIRQDEIRQEAIRQEAIRQEGIRQEGIRQDEIRQEGIRQDEIRQDEIRQEGIYQEEIRQGLKRFGVGTFSSYEATEIALSELKNNGFLMDRVSLVGLDIASHTEVTGAHTSNRLADVGNLYTSENKAEGTAKDGAIGGGAVGGFAGLLVGLGLIAIPGVGPVILAGAAATAIATAVSGGVIGAAAGSLAGGLIGLGIPANRAKVYSDRVSQGDYLVMVEGSEADIALAESIFRNHGIHEWYDGFPNDSAQTGTIISTHHSRV